MGNSLLETKVAGAAAFAKFMTVLQAVADAQQPPTAAALARACGYPRPTVYRILAALAEQGMLMESGGAYRLGPRLLQLASRSWSQFDLRAALAPSCRRCATPPARPCTWRCPPAPRWSISTSWKVPVRCAWCRAWARAWPCIPAPWARLIWPRWARPSANGCWTDCRWKRACRPRWPACRPCASRWPRPPRGYAVDDEENEPGIVCYGVALRDAGGRPVAGVSVSTLLFRRRDDPQSAYIDPLLRLRDAAAAKLAMLPVASGAA